MSEKRTAIIYVSTHHGCTKKVAEAIAAQDQVDLIDIVDQKDADISCYDRIGIAAGIAFGKYYPQMLTYLEKHMPDNKEVFFLHTAGDPKEKHNTAAKAITDQHNCKYLGTFYCKGFDTFGPFKLVGGINKNHPDQEDLANAVAFYQGLK